MSCCKPGERSRLIYAIREYRGRKDEPKGFGWRGFRDLLIRARTQLGGPIVLMWDNVRLHLTSRIREFIDANAEWLTVFQLPTYAPDLNPQPLTWAGRDRERHRDRARRLRRADEPARSTLPDRSHC
ncbi:transposase [Streptomyces sp. NPDC096033]|uniref:transposase n=1 Tax=Streptomyces sp. NPDC096033 TaxID=3366071 RepID=UPI00380706EA